MVVHETLTIVVVVVCGGALNTHYSGGGECGGALNTHYSGGGVCGGV